MQYQPLYGNIGDWSALGQIRNPLRSLLSGHSRQIAAVQQYFAGLQGQKAGDGLEQGRFSAAIGTDDGSNLFGCDGKIQIPKNRFTGIAGTDLM